MSVFQMFQLHNDPRHPPWQQGARKHLHTKVLLLRSIFPVKGPHVVPTGSCCRLWTLRSPSFWTTSSSPANKEHKQCLEGSLLALLQTPPCLLCMPNIQRTPGMRMNYTFLKKNNQSGHPAEEKQTSFFTILFKGDLEGYIYFYLFTGSMV